MNPTPTKSRRGFASMDPARQREIASKGGAGVALERVTQLTSPPAVGQLYLVPTVLYRWLRDVEAAWPVFPIRHEDAEHLNFEWQHYHVDPRFLNARETRKAANYHWIERTPHICVDDWPARAEATSQVTPLQRRDRARPDGTEPHPAIVWQVRKCHRATIGYHWAAVDPIKTMRSHYAGQQCPKGRAGWVCPHKRFPLGSIAVVDGVQTCPLHGLRIDAATGIVLAADHPALAVESGRKGGLARQAKGRAR